MSAAVTRRALVGGAAAALTVAGFPASAETGIPASNPEPTLSAVIARFDAARAAWDAAADLSEAAMQRAVAMTPTRPDALQWRLTDFPGTALGRGLSDPEGGDGGRVYGARAVAWLRDRPAEAWFPNLPPRPEWEARRREIVEAYGAWGAACEAATVASGLRAACEAEDRAEAAWYAADDEVKGYQPVTLADLRTKAGWVAERLAIGNADDDLGEVFARQVAAFNGAAP